MNDRLRKMSVTALGLGRLPVAPGTWGSAGAAAVYVGLRYALPGPWHVAALGAGVVLCVALGVRLGPWAESHYGKTDPGAFALDEVAGQWVACAPLLFLHPLTAAAFGFVAFRVFDILKPAPIRRLEHLPAGWGVMLDDLLAGLYAAALVTAAHGLAYIC